jgi:uncharacterized lipoprotein YajG
MKKRIILSSMAAFLLLCGCQENIDERITRELQEYSRRNCPNRIGNQVLDSTAYDVKTRTILYYYTLDEDLDSIVRARSEEMTDALRKSLKEDLTTKYYKENQVNFQYIYRSYDGKKEVLNILFTPKDYK